MLLAALDRLVEVEGIAEAADRLGVTYRAASNCHESRHVSGKMREALDKYVREQAEPSEKQEYPATAPVPDEPAANRKGVREGLGLQEPAGDIRSEVEALRAEGTPYTLDWSRAERSRLELDLRLVGVYLDTFALNTTVTEVHAHGTGAPREKGGQSIGPSRGGWTTKRSAAVLGGRTRLTLMHSPDRMAMPPGDAPCRFP